MAGRDGSVHLLDYRGKEHRLQSRMLGFPIRSISVSPDLEWAAFSSRDGELEVWRVATAESARLTFDTPILATAIAVFSEPLVVSVEQAGRIHELKPMGLKVLQLGVPNSD